MDLSASPFFLNGEQIQWVRRTLDGMTDAQKIGQLFCVMGGDFTPDVLREMVRDGRVGGILFRPVKTREAIVADYAPLDAASRVPLLKAANLEEGGSGGMSDGTLFGWPMLVAATDDVAQVERFARVCAVEGRSAGINWTFSPVCDLDMNCLNPITNVRTYGSSLDRVRRFSRAYVETVQSRGMAACAKHYPGDGVDYRDQHLHPTYNTLSAREWFDTYGAVYRDLIAAGLMSVMVGHIGQPNVARATDPCLSDEACMLPASLNRTLLTDVLRGDLGFNGVITTDATIMGGFCMAMERRKAIPASIMAGCDMLVFNTDFEEDFSYLEAALSDGTLTHERLDEAVLRVLALKAKVCFTPPSEEKVDAQAWHRACADAAITLVKQLQPQALPITPQRYPTIRLITLGKDDIPAGSVRGITREILEREGFDVEVYNPLEDDLHGTSRLPGDRLTLFMANYEQASNQTVVRVNWCPKHALDMPRFVHEEVSVFVSLANPYMLQDVPRVRAYINAYTATRATIELTIDKLMGRSAFKGTSPVDAFCGLCDTRL